MKKLLVNIPRYTKHIMDSNHIKCWGSLGELGATSMDDALLRQGQRENKKVVPGADGGDICRGKFRSSAEPSCHSSRLLRIEMAGPRSQLILKYTSS